MVAQAVRLSNLDIDNALKNKDFEVLFQPIFDLGNGALARVESFIRWRHPTLGVLPPGAFISFFETQGRMSELTRYVLSEALGAYQGWRGPFAPGFSINLALSDLSDESFPSHFSLLTRNAGFPVELVTLECPMPAVDADMAAVARQLQRLAATGARLAIEVRGRATDFLHTVDPFPFAEIKTGGAAILRFARTVRGPGLSAISELLELAAKRNAAITAVGVEDQASLSALKGLGFAAAQGNHLGKVGPLNQFLPSHVNSVRAHLGLEPLSSDDLAALFRTGAPAFSAPPPARVHEGVAESAAGDDFASQHAAAPVDRDDQEKIIERLAARLARADEPARAPSADQPADDAGAKAAAIAKARQRTVVRDRVARDRVAARNALREKAEQADARQGTPVAARDMQDRLAREFEAFADEPNETPAAQQTPEPQSPPQSPPIADDTGDLASMAASFDDAATAAESDPTFDPTADDMRAEHAPGPMAVPAAPAAGDRPVAAAPPSVIPAQHRDKQRPELRPASRIVKARMPVNGAGARFVQTLRVSGAEGVTPIPAPAAPAPRHQPSGAADSAAAALTQAAIVEDALDQEIPAAGPSTEWVEETVAIAAAFAPRQPRRRRRKVKNFLGIPYTGYFWPRPLRAWAANRRALREARLLEE